MKNNKGKGKGDMEFKEVKKIYDLMVNSDLLEIEVEEKNCKIKIKRKNEERSKKEKTVVDEKEYLSPVSLIPSEEEDKKKESDVIKSPIPGIFYQSPSPESPPFVEVNSIVEKDETICIIEAMKVMNEIQAERKCKIVQMLVENGKTVKYGEELFSVCYL